MKIFHPYKDNFSAIILGEVGEGAELASVKIPLIANKRQQKKADKGGKAALSIKHFIFNKKINKIK